MSSKKEIAWPTDLLIEISGGAGDNERSSQLSPGQQFVRTIILRALNPGKWPVIESEPVYLYKAATGGAHFSPHSSDQQQQQLA